MNFILKNCKWWLPLFWDGGKKYKKLRTHCPELFAMRRYGGGKKYIVRKKKQREKSVSCYIEILELLSYTTSTLWTIWSISKKLLAITHYGTMSYFLPLYFDIFEALIPSNTSHFPVLSSAYYVIEHIILFNLFTLTQRSSLHRSFSSKLPSCGNQSTRDSSRCSLKLH